MIDWGYEKWTWAGVTQDDADLHVDWGISPWDCSGCDPDPFEKVRISEKITIWRGDCLTIFPKIETNSVDAVICDLPYATTQAHWDSLIPIEPLWAAYKRILKPTGVIVLTAAQPFTTTLVSSNLPWFRWADVWDKVSVTGHLDAKRRPMRQHEDILIFSPVGQGTLTYNPQLKDGKPYSSKAPKVQPITTPVYGAHKVLGKENDGFRYPTSIVTFDNGNGVNPDKVHPTQKPVSLMEYLVLTYTNPGEHVLDNSMGSGSTGEACIRTGRRFTGIEMDPEIFVTSKDRLIEVSTSPLPVNPVALGSRRKHTVGSAVFAFPDANSPQ